ncbi:MAG: helix-turn-helix transcriptional regulator [Beijerinckiaceae bacterium]|nr:helix-turn-helix transcriptional regulator [Beijerinckiaceae bacterium]
MISAPETLDDILFKFHQVAEPISPELLNVWTGRYPQFANEIRAHAVEIMDMELLASTQALAAAQSLVGEAVTLRAALQEAGISLRDFADRLDISRSIVSDINSGRIDHETIPKRFARLGAAQIGKAMDWFEAIVRSSHETAPTPAFKAKAAPSIGRQRTWEEAIRGSDMDEDRRSFWLSNEG